MLTSLSRSFRRIFDTALGRGRAAALAAGGESLAAPQACALRAPPSLRLVQSADQRQTDRDSSITVAAPASGAAPGASAFVAGAGARIYSLEVFRRERSGRPGPRRPAAPRSPRAA